jgi:hypothetical protein
MERQRLRETHLCTPNHKRILTGFNGQDHGRSAAAFGLATIEIPMENQNWNAHGRRSKLLQRQAEVGLSISVVAMMERSRFGILLRIFLVAGATTFVPHSCNGIGRDLRFNMRYALCTMLSLFRSDF